MSSEKFPDRIVLGEGEPSFGNALGNEWDVSLYDEKVGDFVNFSEAAKLLQGAGQRYRLVLEKVEA